MHCQAAVVDADAAHLAHSSDSIDDLPSAWNREVEARSVVSHQQATSQQGLHMRMGDLHPILPDAQRVLSSQELNVQPTSNMMLLAGCQTLGGEGPSRQ